MSYKNPTTDNLFFELGAISVNINGTDHMIACEEITLTVTNENTARYACDIRVPIDISPGKRKFSYSIKKPKFFESDLLYIKAVYGGTFDLKLYRLILKDDITNFKKTLNSDLKKREKNLNKSKKDPIAAVSMGVSQIGQDSAEAQEGEDFLIEHMITLHKCVVDSVSFGSFDGTKPVSEDIQGQGQYVTFSPATAGYYSKVLKGDE